MRVYRIYKENDKGPVFTTDFMDIWDVLDSAEDNQKIGIVIKEMSHSEYMQIPEEQRKEDSI